MVYKPLDFPPLCSVEHTALLRQTHCAVTGKKLLDARATWDFIQNNDLFKRGLVDIVDVRNQLKKIARCNGQGPVFSEGEIQRVIGKSAANVDHKLT